MFLSNSFYIASHGATINFLFWTSSLCFQNFLLIKPISLFFYPWIFSSLLANLFWLILVLLWVVWMLATVHKPCHVPHASRITTCRTIFWEIFFVVSKEWFRSWSRVFLITNIEISAKEPLAICPKKGRKRKKRSKT